jgi:hypothetical protein
MRNRDCRIFKFTYTMETRDFGMKKKYSVPQVEVVHVLMQGHLLIDSPRGNVSADDFQDGGTYGRGSSVWGDSEW